MNRLIREAQTHGERWISIHDAHISQILCQEHSVVFCFNDGFDLIENGQLERKLHGHIELLNCNSSDFSCNVIARRPTRQGAKLYGRPVCLEGLNKILASKNMYVEIFLELYGINHLHWRGELLPYKKITRKQLAPLVTIDTMDSFPMIYSWE